MNTGLDMKETLILASRRKQLNVIKDLFKKSLKGKPAVVSLIGPSGVGKSNISQAFLNSLPKNCLIIKETGALETLLKQYGYWALELSILH